MEDDTLPSSNGPSSGPSSSSFGSSDSGPSDFGPAGDAAARLASEDLDPYSQDELTRRIHLLEREIARVEKHRLTAAAHRSAADALFGRKE